MSDEVSWHVELVVQPGQLENFRALTAEMVEAVRREPGVLAYQRFIREDGRTVDVVERYANSAAALTHLETFAKKFAGRFHGLVERKRFVVFGDPAAELKAVLDGYGATYAKPLGGSAIAPR